MAQLKNPPAMWETWVWSLGWEDPLEKGKATHSCILPGEFHGLYSLWGRKELDMTERLLLSLGERGNWNNVVVSEGEKMLEEHIPNKRSPSTIHGNARGSNRLDSIAFWSTNSRMPTTQKRGTGIVRNSIWKEDSS